MHKAVFEKNILLNLWTLILLRMQCGVMVQLGIRRSKFPQDRPLTLQDISPPVVKSSTKRSYEAISGELEACRSMHGGKILYATTEGGSNIKKALAHSNITHVCDLTHAIAVMLSKIYEKEETFKAFTSEMRWKRLKSCRSKHAFPIHPNQRSKSRFLNIYIISNWGMKAIEILKKKILSREEEQELLWIKEKNVFTEEMNSIIKSIESVSLILKHQGLGTRTAEACRKAIENHSGFPKHLQFKDSCTCTQLKQWCEKTV